MGVVALEAVVEKGAIRLDSFWDLPERTKVFVLIPDIESPAPEASSAVGVNMPAEQESALELGKRLQEIARTPGPKKVKVTDFAGLGADMWSSIDVDAYIEEERNSWESSWIESLVIHISGWILHLSSIISSEIQTGIQSCRICSFSQRTLPIVYGFTHRVLRWLKYW